MCKCYKIEQAINHHDIKVSRQEAQKEIEFGLETYNEVIEDNFEIDSYIPAEVMFLVNSGEDFRYQNDANNEKRHRD